MLKLRRFLTSRYVSSAAASFSTKAERESYAKKKSLYGELFPDKLLNKKQKTPQNLYLANAEAAQLIDECIEPHLQLSQCETALELNPGIGLFTRKLLDREERFRKIILIETLDHFMPNLHELHALYPERVKVKQGDLVDVWKLSYQDKMDNGTRVADLLSDVPKRAHEEDTNMLVFGAVGSYNFFKSLINSMVFQNSLLSLGRCELYLVVPPPIYIHLTCSNDIGYLLYRSTSMLFQILFEYRFISQVPRDHFLPTQTEFNISKGSKLGRVKSINPENLYLVKIVPRREIFDLCPAVDLPALWYFVKQNCISRRNRVIPNLEKWIPGCGPRLIINSQHPEPVRPLFADEDPKKLPKYSAQCTTMSRRNFYPKMNIYTQFGDLSPSQMLTLFVQFRHWPEYSESSFLASLENSLLKLEASPDDSIDTIAEEDDVSSSEMATEGIEEEVPAAALEEEPTKKTTVATTKRKKKVKATN